MQTKRNTSERSKVKIGTILDKGIVDRLKERAAREGKAISALIEDAVLHYDQPGLLDRDMRLKALDSFRAIRFNLSSEDWGNIMEEDYFEQ